jgi:hypothetical protein
MRTKDSYQEHMPGYLVGVQTYIKRLEGSPQVRRRDLIEIYEHLDNALEHLWWVIHSSDTEWEPLRFHLEACCHDLLSGYQRVLLRWQGTEAHRS